MTTETRALDGLSHSLEILDRWREGTEGATVEDTLDRTALQASAPVVFARIAELHELVGLGNTAELIVEGNAWSIRMDGRPPGGFTVTAEGAIEEAFDEDQLPEAQAAIDAQDCARMLELCRNMQATVRLTVINRPEVTGFHWIRNGVALQRSLSERWLGMFGELFGSEERQTILVQDAGAGFVEASGLSVRGPEAPAETAMESPWSADVARYWETYLADGRLPAPPPSAIAPVRASAMQDLSRLLGRLASDLSWYWLAARVTGDSDRLRLRFDGARVADVGFPPSVLDYEEEPLQLWRWAVANPDPDRRQAVQQAASLALFDDADILSAARPVLRTAQSLYQLARQGAVAEALATRRSAREAATAAARSAADAARTATGKALDRVGVQLVALAGVLVAQNKEALGRLAAARLSAAVLLLLLVTALISLVFEYPAANGILASFDRDLEQYREALATTDIDAVRRMDSLVRAKLQVRRAWTFTTLVFAASLAAVAYFTGWLLRWHLASLLR